MRHLFRLTIGRRGVRREVDTELRFHLDMRAREFEESGMSRREARRAALAAFGRLGEIEDECVAIRTRRMARRRQANFVRGVGQDLRFAVRMLRRSPGFAVAVLTSLALGIGANTAIFSLIHGILLAPLPFHEGQRLVRLLQPVEAAQTEDAGFSPTEIAEYRARSGTLESLVEYHAMAFILLGHGGPQRVQTGVVSADFFAVLGIEPFLGRTFLAGEDRPGSAPVLVLSHEFWRRNFGRDPTVVGRQVEMNDREHTIVGVLPPLPPHPDRNDVYMPVSACPFRSGPFWSSNRGARGVAVFARLRDRATLEGVRSDLAVIADAQHVAHPDFYPATQGFRTSAIPLREELIQGATPRLLFLFGTSLFLLLIVCANVANLTLMRLVRRSREIALRTAIGAGRSRLFRQLFTESAALALLGGALSLVIAIGGLELLIPLAARYTPRAAEVRMDHAVLLFAFLAALATALVMGALPALPAHRNPAADLRLADGSGRLRARGLLIVSQVAIAFVLLIGAGLFMQSFLRLQAVDPGFDHANVITARLDLNWSAYNARADVLGFVDRLERRLRETPGVQNVAVANAFPLNRATPGSFEFRIRRLGHPADELPRGDSRMVTPDYFAAMGIPVLRGRTFRGGEYERGDHVVVINEAMAARYWPGEDPVGARVWPEDGEQQWHTVVGVVGDVREYVLERDPLPLMYANFGHNSVRDSRLIVRASSSPAELKTAIQQAVREIDPHQPVTEVRTLEAVRQETLAPPRLIMLLLAFFAAVALVITAAGIAGVMGYSVSRRTQEIGVRMALGAHRRSVLRMVMGQALGLVLVGAALGAGVALALARGLSNLLFGITATDAATFLLVFAILVTVATAASFIPARRATEIDPSAALRSD